MHLAYILGSPFELFVDDISVQPKHLILAPLTPLQTVLHINVRESLLGNALENDLRVL